jgi:hypothetical protein
MNEDLYKFLNELIDLKKNGGLGDKTPDIINRFECGFKKIFKDLNEDSISKLAHVLKKHFKDTSHTKDEGVLTTEFTFKVYRTKDGSHEMAIQSIDHATDTEASQDNFYNLFICLSRYIVSLKEVNPCVRDEIRELLKHIKENHR